MKRSKIVIGILVGIIALASFSVSSSVAWYASSANVGVQYFDVEVSGGPDLKVSIQKDDLSQFGERANASDLDKIDKPFFPVSAMKSDTWMGGEKPVFYDYHGGFGSRSGEPNGMYAAIQGYFSNPIYLLTDADSYVTIDAKSTFVNSLVEANRRAIEAGEIENLAGYSEEVLLERLNSLEKAMRISIYDPEDYVFQYNIFDPHKDGTTLYGGVLDNDKDTYFDTYYGSDDKPRDLIYGEVYHRELAVYGEPLEDKQEAIGELTCFNANRRANTMPFDLEASLSNGLQIAEEPSRLLEECDSDFVSDDPEARSIEVFSSDPTRFAPGSIDEEKLKSKIDTSDTAEYVFAYDGANWNYNEEAVDLSEYGLKANLVSGEALKEGDKLIVTVSKPNPVVIKCYANVPKAIYLSIYLEGWDLDCVNASMGGHFYSNVSFRVISSMNRIYS